jgi:hypothetical protein
MESLELIVSMAALEDEVLAFDPSQLAQGIK